jgi:hypothetical protein
MTIKRNAIGIIALAIATSASAGNTYDKIEKLTGVRYHTVGFDRAFNTDAARQDAWKKATAECDQRQGYMTEFQAGATRPVVTTLIGVASPAYATCRTDMPAPLPDEHRWDDIIPEAHIDATTPRMTVSAKGGPRNSYISVRNKAESLCRESGKHIEHLSVGFFTIRDSGSATANFSCSP